MSIHHTALIDDSARIGQGVSVGPYAVIEAQTEIGDGCQIASHAVVKRYTRLGRNNHLAEHVVLGGEPQDFKFQPCESWVEIGDDNRLREGVTVHRSNHAGGVTRVGSGCFLMAYSHVAHDCTLADRVVLANGALLGGHVEIGERAFISGAVTLHQFCRVGPLALVAASARVSQDCLPFAITDGNPGRARALNVVGLRRAGWAASEMAALKRAFQALRSLRELASILDELQAQNSPAVQQLAAFIRTSRRGFAHFR
ncbi:acyl-ACP--UDP-N-acetylglucosamine O-acyltransferase [Hydrogenophaga sp.]|uniref:acyl-ACP--UDP-N-acetylglucosamine O-acyltransferase n=1 Tax=Hydrogenophaga sp. TaxID=1904254 RepID=UPI0019B1DB42|nr:acyl-ACP--UDP-N-acetylglucosamine O-acyltransferase [Hydrogenophaga sp.]MBD3893430.1 acyl-ACP--UDP-N-acetylglucosamine O-acyltransferase [Hydrogenophaga sp.]